LEIVLAGALASGASDIHFEPEDDAVKLRLRLDGLLHDVFTKLKHDDYSLLLSRIKLLSGLKLNILSGPQDGRYTIGAGEREIEIRTSILPSEMAAMGVSGQESRKETARLMAISANLRAPVAINKTPITATHKRWPAHRRFEVSPGNST